MILVGKVNDGPSRYLSKHLVKQVKVLVIIEINEKNKVFPLDVITRLYAKEGLSAREIAKRFSCSKSTVLKQLKKNGIKIRLRHLPHGRQSQPRFGNKRIHGKITSHKEEMKTVGVIKNLYDKGLSLREICKIMSEMKIPTKNKSRKWHPEMIKRILSNIKK